MAQDGILTNIGAIQDALRVYGLVVKKEADLAIRSKMADIAFFAAKNTKFRDRAVIRSEISNLPITKDGGKKRYGNTQYVGQYKLINWERKLKGLATLGNSKFRKIKSYITRPGSMVAEERTRKTKLKSRLAGLGVKSNYYAMCIVTGKQIGRAHV